MEIEVFEEKDAEASDPSLASDSSPVSPLSPSSLSSGLADAASPGEDTAEVDLPVSREDGADGDREEAGTAGDGEEDDITDHYRPDTTTPVFKPPALVPLEELVAVMPTLRRISSWIESVFAHISYEAINNGIEVPGYKVVEGRSRRSFTDTKAVMEAVIKSGFKEDDFYKKQLFSLTDFERKLGKKRFAELLGKFVVKPPGGLTLVPESDPRPAVSTLGAEQEFSVIEDE